MGAKVKLNVLVDLYSASSSNKALRYGTRSQRIPQFYLQTPRSPADRMDPICL